MEPQEKTNGALIGSIIIIVILIIGGIYFWKTSVKNLPANTETSTSGNTQDDTASLDADVNSVDLDSLDSDL
ncbi:MAG: hypothetical protein KBC06_02155 [Candidatus Pacebacteria bacterium]|nr:hypothetical protein [Candidatus Paceibacterota bacterium]